MSNIKGNAIIKFGDTELVIDSANYNHTIEIDVEDEWKYFPAEINNITDLELFMGEENYNKLSDEQKMQAGIYRQGIQW